MKFIKNVDIILPEKIIKNGAVLFDESIKKIYKIDDYMESEFDKETIEIIDGKEGYLTPGFIDIHIHGTNGKDAMDATYEAIDTISENVIKSGVTHFLPTTMTMAKQNINEALKNIKKLKDKELSGAQILGVNVEGPFLNKEKKGAQPEEYILDPNLDLLKNYIEIIKLVTIAPEKPGAEDFIKEMNKRGIVTSVGHSTASYEDIQKANKWGLSHTTHLFNGMVGLHHRRPGVVGAALTNDMTVELIADLIHLSPVILDLVSKTKSEDEIILITDSMRAAGLEDGEYSLGGQKVIVKEGEARLEAGSLAGSTLTLDRAVKNMYNSTELELKSVIKMVTKNPAKLLGVDNKKGKIENNYDADLVVLDKTLEVKKVFVKGEQKY